MDAGAPVSPFVGVPARVAGLAPGLVPIVIVSAVAVGLGALESAVLGRPLVEPLVIAMLIGMVVRAVHTVQPRAEPGIRFFAKEVLEAAVLLLGATMDVPRLFASGPLLALGIAGVVCAAVTIGYLDWPGIRPVAEAIDARRVR